MKLRLLMVLVLANLLLPSLARAGIIIRQPPDAYLIQTDYTTTGRGFHAVFEFVDYDERYNTDTNQIEDPPARGPLGQFFNWNYDPLSDPLYYDGSEALDQYRFELRFTAKPTTGAGWYMVWAEAKDLHQPPIDRADDFWVLAFALAEVTEDP